MFPLASEPHGAAVPARLSSPMDALGYVGHGKGPWDATTYDFRENFVLPPLAPAPLAVFFPAPMSAHNVRRRSPEFVEARTQRLLLDTLFKYGHPCVLSDHAVELIREEIEQARSGDPISETISASIDTTSTKIFPSYVHHQSWLLSLFV